jgi:predicted metal-dependent hydrolase
MSTASAYLTVSGIDIDVVYKDVKNLHIGVYPPLGRVRVAAPQLIGDDQVRLAVVQRLAWIKRHRRRLVQADRQSLREMVTGESHYVWGRRYRLEVVAGRERSRIELDGTRLVLRHRSGMKVVALRRVLDEWYRGQLREAIPSLVAKWAPKVGVKAPGWNIRRMKTKWGSCTSSGTIWLNLELAKKHPHGLEYIVVHELVHLVERGHGERFTKLMDELLPDWRARRDQLNDEPLAEEQWSLSGA